jgi:hypothetical protein
MGKLILLLSYFIAPILFFGWLFIHLKLLNSLIGAHPEWETLFYFLFFLTTPWIPAYGTVFFIYILDKAFKK